MELGKKESSFDRYFESAGILKIPVGILQFRPDILLFIHTGPYQ